MSRQASDNWHGCCSSPRERVSSTPVREEQRLTRSSIYQGPAHRADFKSSVRGFRYGYRYVHRRPVTYASSACQLNWAATGNFRDLSPTYHLCRLSVASMARERRRPFARRPREPLVAIDVSVACVSFCSAWDTSVQTRSTGTIQRSAERDRTACPRTCQRHSGARTSNERGRRRLAYRVLTVV